eukprot:11298772-Karenia_brevis.AAC.1
MPFHVTDSSQLRIYCPERYCNYSHGVEGYVPIWKEKVRFELRDKRIALSNYYSMPSCCGCRECPPALPNVPGEPVEVVPDAPLENPDEVVDDPT